MAESVVERYLGEGKLRLQNAPGEQIESLLRQAVFDVEEAGRIAAVAERAAYLLAYVAMLKAGRALLLSLGYAPEHDRHRTIIEVAADILGARYMSTTTQFEIMRRKSSEITHGAGALLSKTESRQALSNATFFIEKVAQAAGYPDVFSQAYSLTRAKPKDEHQ